MPAGRSLPLRRAPPKGSLPLAPTVPRFQLRQPAVTWPMQRSQRARSELAASDAAADQSAFGKNVDDGF